MTGGFVSVDAVVRRFGDVVAVDQADLAVEQRSITALLGPSGCGKTTLLRLIGGLDVPTSGTIHVDGTLLSGPSTFVPPERRQVVMVFQDFALFPHMTVAKNIAFGLPKRANKTARVQQLLAMVGLSGLHQRMPHELSGGQQQRVALARALAAEPRLILLDEPFSNLDPSIRQRVRLDVRQLLRDSGITAIFVTHDQDEALSLADQVAVMIAGRVMQVGTPQSIYRTPQTRAVADFIGHPNFLPGTVQDGRATCELGTFPVSAAFAGAAQIMVRTESLTPTCEGGVPVEVCHSEYFGHEQMLTLRLASGTVVRSRWRSAEVLASGAATRVAVAGDIHAFPTHEG